MDSDEKLGVYRARMEQLKEIESSKAAVGRTVVSAGSRPFTMGWLVKQLPGMEPERIDALLSGFLLRNGWVKTAGISPNGSDAWVMDSVGERCFKEYDRCLQDIQERGIDPVVETRLRLLQMGLTTEEVDDAE